MNSPQIQTSFRLGKGDWSDPELIQSLEQSEEENEAWLLTRWTPSPPSENRIYIEFFSPANEAGSAFCESLAKQIRQRVQMGLHLACQDRGWPTPVIGVSNQSRPQQEHWTYRIKTRSGQSEESILHPNKILAVGQDESLNTLLGLEHQDPIFGLPAKWITHSQVERAEQNGALVFEAPALVAAHAVSFSQDSLSRIVGSWDIYRWLSEGLEENQHDVLDLMMRERGLISNLVKELIAYNLYLPSASEFGELVQSALVQANGNGSLEDLILLLRKPIVEFNLDRWFDSQGRLWTIDWMAPEEISSETHHRMLTRLGSLLASFQEEGEGTPVLVVAPEQLKVVYPALSTVYPGMPILCWSDLAGLACPTEWGAVSHELKIVPSRPTLGLFRTDYEKT